MSTASHTDQSATATTEADHPANTSANGTKRRVGGQPGNRNAAKHGGYNLRHALKVRGLAAISKRTKYGRIIKETRLAIYEFVAGPAKDPITGEERTDRLARLTIIDHEKIDRYLQTKVQLDVIDVYIAELSSLVNRRSRSLWPVILQRKGLVETERTQRQDVEALRYVPQPKTLADYIAAYDSKTSQPAAPVTTEETP